MKLLSAIFFLLFFGATNIQAQFLNQYFIEFKYKKSNFSIQQPQDFLSKKSIDRRIKQGIAIDSTDLPIVKDYIDSVVAQGLNIVGKTKWLNGVVVSTNNIAALNYLKAKWFVKGYMQVKEAVKSTARVDKFLSEYDTNLQSDLKDTYGAATPQIEMLHGDFLHQNNFYGNEMTIAILDGGFKNVNINPSFEQHRNAGRVIDSFSYVYQNRHVYNTVLHGAAVYSIMAGNENGKYVGTAPMANYCLYHTENTASEYPVEEYYWSMGAERADSIGADLINSSLGYSLFDAAQYDHIYLELDGNTTPAAKAASLAGNKGMVVCISAGNSGAEPWYYIATPADANNVLTIGSVDSLRHVSSFSSRGYSVDKRVKPDVSAMGENIKFINEYNTISYGSGTSFSSPVICGLAACLWQKHKTKTATEIRNAIIKSCNLYENPNAQLGYGIPDFRLADYILEDKNNPLFEKNIEPIIAPNPLHNQLSIYFYADKEQSIELTIFNVNGVQILQQQYPTYQNTFAQIRVNEVENISDGVYLITIKIGNKKFMKKFVKI